MNASDACVLAARCAGSASYRLRFASPSRPPPPFLKSRFCVRWPPLRRLLLLRPMMTDGGGRCGGGFGVAGESSAS